jgi:STELLO glycosyltransferases
MSTALVVTSINPPNSVMRELAAGCIKGAWNFIVAGDSKSPADFSLEGCRFLGIEAQRQSGFLLGRICPERSYTRKNLGYLAAMRNGATVIVETDDDNHPHSEFWLPRMVEMKCRPVELDGWVNAYRYFSENFIYPRGLPLDHARADVPAADALGTFECPVQQGLADSDPDVDAVYRMLFPLPFHFELPHDPVLLRNGAWCPFNSQNTTFFQSAFPLLYLPAKCSFRMTDIWRSFVAQRVLQTKGFGVVFHSPTVWQERNAHDLHRDFTDELPGYVNNAKMREVLAGLPLQAGDSMRILMETCYQTLIRHEWVGSEEEILLQAWFEDLQALGQI